MKQIIQPNLNASDIVAYCERFAERVWRATKTYPFAINGWNAVPTEYRHTGEPPSGVYVQMYWSYQSAGHTATSLGDGRILSSPWKVGTTQAILASRTELEAIYSDNYTPGKVLTYLGWTEYFNGVLVAQEEEMEAYTMTWDDIQMFKQWLGLPVNDGDKGFVGMDPRAFMFAIVQGNEYQTYLKGLQAGQNKGFTPYAGQTLYTKNS